MTDRPAPNPGVRTPGGPTAYGIDSYSVEQVFSYGFQGFDPFGDNITDNGNGYRWMTDSTDSHLFIGNVHIPSGVIIDYIGLNYCDNNPAAAMGLTMYKSFGDNNFDTIGSISSVDFSSCGYIYNVSPLNYLYDKNTLNLLSLYVFQGAVDDGTINFRGAEVWYRRVVSPATGQTFGDVPPAHPFYQFIEAIAAAGITVGCGGGNFCPDQPLTRQQEAAFLAKALGLHWPN